MSHLFHNSVIGFLKSANFNTTSDQSISINCSKYTIRKIVVTNTSTSLTLATGGFYNDINKPAGGILVAAAQVYSALTGPSKYVDTTPASLATTDIQTSPKIYLSLTVAQGLAATADIYILGDILET